MPPTQGRPAAIDTGRGAQACRSGSRGSVNSVPWYQRYAGRTRDKASLHDRNANRCDDLTPPLPRSRLQENFDSFVFFVAEHLVALRRKRERKTVRVNKRRIESVTTVLQNARDVFGPMHVGHSNCRFLTKATPSGSLSAAPPYTPSKEIVPPLRQQ